MAAPYSYKTGGKMKKIFALILSTISLIAGLSGCVREDVDVKINKDGTGRITSTVALKRGFYEQLKDMYGTDPFEEQDIFRTEYDGEKYIAIRIITDYASFEELEKALSEMRYTDNQALFDNEHDSTVEGKESKEGEPTNGEDSFDTEMVDNVDIYEEISSNSSAAKAMNNRIFKSVEIRYDRSKFSFHAVLNAIEGESFGYNLGEVIRIVVTVELPGRITAYSGDLVDDNKVVFDIADLTKETELHAESKTGSSLPAVIVTAVVIAGVAAFVFLRKRK